MIIQEIKNLFTRITYSDNTGETLEEAIVIIGAKNSKIGVDAEFNYISNVYGEENKDWVFEFQALIDSGINQYDLIEIKLKSERKITIFFDITDFYGK